MEQPSNINLYDYPSKNGPLSLPPPSPNNVRGWLLGVHGYRDAPPSILPRSQQDSIGTDNMIAATNHSYGGDAMERRKSISSLASEDSVNLDDLIKANFTLDMDDETDLPNLANLDLGDDSKEDFWKMDKELSDYQSLVVNQKPKDMEYIDKSVHHLHLDSPELSWSPPDDDDEPIETLSPLGHNTTTTRHRSGSINSDNSLNSYSTVTVHQYSRYGMTPMIYQSDSTSTSSRTPSRLSNYSTSSQTSSNATTTLPRPRKVSATSASSMPSPSRSLTTRDETHLLPRAHSRLGTCHLPTANSNGGGSSNNNNNGTRSKLAKRASHIPAPSSISALPAPSNNKSISRPTTIPSSRSTGIPGGRSASRLGDRSSTAATSTTTAKRLATRASHIPSIYERSGSPISNARTSTMSNSPIRNSVFGLRRDDEATSRQTSSSSTTGLRSMDRQQRRREGEPSPGKSTGMRPPSDVRSSSRIGLRKL